MFIYRVSDARTDIDAGSVPLTLKTRACSQPVSGRASELGPLHGWPFRSKMGEKSLLIFSEGPASVARPDGLNDDSAGHFTYVVKAIPKNGFPGHTAVEFGTLGIMVM